MPSSAPASHGAPPRSLHDALPIYRHVARGHPHDRRVEDVDRPLGDERGQLGAPAPALDRLVGDHEPAGLGDRRENRRLVERDEGARSEEHTSELQSLTNIVCRLLLRHPTAPPLVPYTTLFRSIGTLRAATRTIGASRTSIARSATSAASSAPQPPRLTASWAITSRPVLATDVRIVASSSGTRVRDRKSTRLNSSH